MRNIIRLKTRLFPVFEAVLLAVCLYSGPAGAVVRLEVPDSNLFSSGGVDYAGLEFLLHIPEKGNVWIAIPFNHDLETGPITPLVVVDPTGVDPLVKVDERPSIRSLHDQLDGLPNDSRIGLRPAQPYLGEIRLFAGNMSPPGWYRCDGRLLAIRDNLGLFGVIGNIYGGDGRTTLGIPDLRGRVPMGMGAGPGLTYRKIGQKVGSETVTLDVTQIPSHNHSILAVNSLGNQTKPEGHILAGSTGQYSDARPTVKMDSSSIGSAGGNDPHPNMQPYTVMNYMIAYHDDYARSRFPNASKWPVSPDSAPPQYKVNDVGVGTAVTLEPNVDYGVNLVWELFRSGGVEYIGLDIIEHEDGIGLIWFAMFKNHDLTSGPVTPKIVLSPGDFLEPGVSPEGDGRTSVGIGDRLYAISQVVVDFMLKGWGQGTRFNYGKRLKATRVDEHSGLQFTSGGVDYLGLDLLQHEDGIGTIWIAIPKNHDLDSSPVSPVIVLAPDVVTAR